MPSEVFKRAGVVLGTVSFATDVQSVTMNYEAENLDGTTMGRDTRVAKGGLKNWSFAINLLQQFGASKDGHLFGLVGTEAAIKVRVNATADLSATNPEYQGTGLIQSFQPFGQSVGELAVGVINVVAASDLLRATSTS